MTDRSWPRRACLSLMMPAAIDWLPDSRQDGAKWRTRPEADVGRAHTCGCFAAVAVVRIRGLRSLYRALN
jgi:hypothetical protein